MSIKNLGIIGGGQLGSLLAVAAKKLNINTIKKRLAIPLLGIENLTTWKF